MSLQQNLSYSSGIQPASCYQNSPATPGYHCQWAGKNCVGGNSSLAESGNFFIPNLTGNYRDCVQGTTGGTISPDLALSDSLSQDTNPGTGAVQLHGGKSWQSGYLRGAPNPWSLFIENCVFILTWLNFDHLQSILHSMQYTYFSFFFFYNPLFFPLKKFPLYFFLF